MILCLLVYALLVGTDRHSKSSSGALVVVVYGPLCMLLSNRGPVPSLAHACSHCIGVALWTA